MFKALLIWEQQRARQRPNFFPLTLVMLLPLFFPTGFWFCSPWIMVLYALSLTIGYRVIRSRSQDAEDAVEAHYLLSRPIRRRDWILARLAFALIIALCFWSLLIPYSQFIRGLIHDWFVDYFAKNIDPPSTLDDFYRSGTPGWWWGWALSLIFCLIGSVLALLRQLQERKGKRRLRTLAIWSPLLLSMLTLSWIWLKHYGSRQEPPFAVGNVFLDLDQPWMLLSISLSLLALYLFLCVRRLKHWDQGA